MALIESIIRTFTKPHGSGGEGGKTTIINVGGTEQNNYDNKNLNVTSINAVRGDINELTTRNLTTDNFKASWINADSGNITNLSGSSLNYSTAVIPKIESSDITTDKITVKDTADINNLINNTIQSKSIVTDDLVVNQTAHFFELIIDKINSVGGTIMNTATNCTANYTEAYDNNYSLVPIDYSGSIKFYRIYWRTSNNEGQNIDNKWLVNDQAICQSFNLTDTTGTNVSNKYYWRLVTATDKDVNGDANKTTGKRYVNLNEEYTFDTQNKPKVSDTAIDYWITFSNGFTYVSDGVSFNGFTDEAITGSTYNTNTKTLTVNSIGDGIKIYADDYVIGGGYLTFDTDSYTKMNITVVYEDETTEFVRTSTYKNQYIYNTATGKTVSYFLITTDTVEVWEKCNWIDLSYSDNDGGHTGESSRPEAGDNICQLGYRYGNNPSATDKARASAIIIASYKTPDAGVQPPSYAQYQNITDYNLSSHRKTYFDATGGHIIGEFKVQTNANDPAVPLDQYIQSYNNANPLKAYISTNNNEYFDLIVIQTDNNNEIHGLNNFPSNMQILLSYENSTLFDPNDYDVLSLDLFGVTYDLLDSSYNPNNYLPSGYEGIYLQNLYPASIGMNPAPFRLIFNFMGSNQTVTSTSMILYGEVTRNGTTYNINKTIPISSVSSVEGTDAEVWQLFSDTEICEVISSNDSNNGKLQWLFRYGLIHIVGTTASFSQGTSGMYVIVKSYNSSGQEIDSYMDVAPFIHSGGKAGEYYCEFGGGIPTDWWSLTDLSEREMYFIVQLFNSNNECLDSKTVPVIIQPTGLFTVEEGLTQSIQANTTAIQTANGNISGLQTNFSTLTQTVNGINTTVSQQQVSISNLNSSVSQIDQKADSIDLRVTQTNTDLSNLETDLQTTGIDITNGTIELRANKVTFTDSTGTINNKISIDPTTGTLNAVDGNFSGTINASNGQFGPNSEVFNLALNADVPSLKLTGCKYVKCDTNSNVIYPYEKYDSSTLENFQYIDISCSNWTNSNIPAGSTYGSIGLDPTITLRTPYAGYNSSTDDYYSEIQISPNRGLEFYNKINGTKNVNGVISNNGIYINGSLGLGQTFVLLNNFSNNTAARNAGLNVGDVYHTNGTLKVVI